jgi:hypothetical protein
LSFLYQGLGCYNFEKVSEAATSKELWDKLGVIYKGVERVKKLRLQKLREEFETTRMKGEAVCQASLQVDWHCQSKVKKWRKA